MNRIIALLLIFFITQANVLAQNGICAIEASTDTTYNNTIRDTITLTCSQGTVTFETITREDGKYYAMTSEGQKKEITSFINGQNRVLVKDTEGHELVIDKDGNVMGVEEYHATGGNKLLLRENMKAKDAKVVSSSNVTFTKYGNAYLFDSYDTYATHSSSANYAKRFPTIGEGNYRPAYACAESNSKITLKAEPYKNITFKTERGVPVLCKEGLIEVTARGDRDTTAVYAYGIDGNILGKVNIMSYDKITQKVCLVPIGKTQAPDASLLKNGLDEMFAQLMIDYEVTISDPIKIDYTNGIKFTHGGSGILGVYNADQKSAIDKLKETISIDNETCYLFLIPEAITLKTDGTNDIVNGYMPRGYQFGFIYNELSNTKTIAHELCHGAYHLRHTFDEADYLAPEGTTDNLMDYAAANDRTFNHWQWQDIHQPKNVRFKWAQDEEGAEWTTDGHYFLFTYVGQLLGVDKSLAKYYGELSELPDTYIGSYETRPMRDFIGETLSDMEKVNSLFEDNYEKQFDSYNEFTSLIRTLKDMLQSLSDNITTTCGEIGKEDGKDVLIKSQMLQKIDDQIKSKEAKNDKNKEAINDYNRLYEEFKTLAIVNASYIKKAQDNLQIALDLIDKMAKEDTLYTNLAIQNAMFYVQKAFINSLLAENAELKAEIAEKDEIIAEKDEIIAEKDEIIAEKDEIIAELKVENAELKVENAELKAEIVAKDKQISDLLKEREQLNKSVYNASLQIDNAHKNINDIATEEFNASVSWHENFTWASGRLQQQNHALTGGYHGVELAATVYAIKKVFAENNEDYVYVDKKERNGEIDISKRFLLHRFGDCYAHFGKDYMGKNKSADLSEDDINLDMPLRKYIEAIDSYVSECTEEQRYGYSKEDFTRLVVNAIIHADDIRPKDKNKIKKSYDDIIDGVLSKLSASQDNQKMFGDDVTGIFNCISPFTKGHFGYGESDVIAERPNIFRCYARGVVDLYEILLKREIDKSIKESAIDKIDKIVTWAENNKEKAKRLDAILAFTLAQSYNTIPKKFEFTMPIKTTYTAEAGITARAVSSINNSMTGLNNDNETTEGKIGDESLSALIKYLEGTIFKISKITPSQNGNDLIITIQKVSQE